MKFYDIPAKKKAYIERGTKILNEIESLEALAVQDNETKRKLKHLWKQFYEVADFVFDK